MTKQTFKVTGEVLRRTKMGELEWKEIEPKPESAFKVRFSEYRRFEAVDGDIVWRLKTDQSWGQHLSRSVDGGPSYMVASSHYGVGIFTGHRLELLTRQIKSRCSVVEAVPAQHAFTLQ